MSVVDADITIGVVMRKSKNRIESNILCFDGGSVNGFYDWLREASSSVNLVPAYSLT